MHSLYLSWENKTPSAEYSWNLYRCSSLNKAHLKTNWLFISWRQTCYYFEMQANDLRQNTISIYQHMMCLFLHLSYVKVLSPPGRILVLLGILCNFWGVCLSDCHCVSQVCSCELPISRCCQSSCGCPSFESWKRRPGGRLKVNRSMLLGAQISPETSGWNSPSDLFVRPFIEAPFRLIYNDGRGIPFSFAQLVEVKETSPAVFPG